MKRLGAQGKKIKPSKKLGNDAKQAIKEWEERTGLKVLKAKNGPCGYYEDKIVFVIAGNYAQLQRKYPELKEEESVKFEEKDVEGFKVRFEEIMLYFKKEAFTDPDELWEDFILHLKNSDMVNDTKRTCVSVAKSSFKTVAWERSRIRKKTGKKGIFLRELCLYCRKPWDNYSDCGCQVYTRDDCQNESCYACGHGDGWVDEEDRGLYCPDCNFGDDSYGIDAAYCDDCVRYRKKFNHKCPKCGEFIGTGSQVSKKCDKCGVKLKW